MAEKSKKKIADIVPETTVVEVVPEAKTVAAASSNPKEKEAKKAKKKPVAARAEKIEARLPREQRKHSKKYREAEKLVEKGKLYPINEATELIIKTATTKFDSSVEIHVRLNVDPSSADGQVRGSIILPEGTGKERKIAVICGADKEAAAKSAGADLVGSDELIAEIEKGKIDFDVLVATPEMMPKLGKLGRILGVKGLMPSPKSGTISPDPKKIVTELKAGRIEFKVDKNGIIHQVIGKCSFDPSKIEKNYIALMEAIKKAKPQATKGTYILSVSLATTMGPVIKITL